MWHFKYSMVDLIRVVRERPAIWDKSSEIYKDREEKKNAWNEIYRIMEEDFDNLSEAEGRSLADVITNKWTNVRDTFIRSLKNQTIKSGVKRYVYHDEMEFLLKVIPQELIPEYHSYEDAIAAAMNHEAPEYESDILEESSQKKRYKKYERKRTFMDIAPEPHLRKKRSKKSHVKSEPDESQSMEYAEDPRIMNEDEAFFASLLPSVVKYSESERLEFRIEVLAVMKSINEKRKSEEED